MTQQILPDTVQVSAAPAIPVSELAMHERWFAEDLRIELQAGDKAADQVLQDLAGDAFWTTFRSEPEWVDPVPPERALNKRLLDWLTNQPTWPEAHECTRGHIPASLLCASGMWSSLTADDSINAALETQAQADAAAQEAAQAEQEAGIADWTAVGAEAQGDEAAAAQARATAAAARARAQAARAEAAAQGEQAVKTFDEWKEANPHAADAVAAATIHQAGRDAQDEVDAFAGWGFGSGQLARMDVGQVKQLRQQLRDERIRQIAKMAGRLRSLALSAIRSRVSSGPVPATLGRVSDLDDALASELSWLAHAAPAAARAIKASEWVVDGLLGVVRRGLENEQGDFIGGVDVSGSMMGQREIVAKAIVLALAQTALEIGWGRQFCLFAFSSDNDAIIQVTSEDVDRDPTALFQWAAASLHGGTSFDVPLRRFSEWIAGRRNADAVLISDGEAIPSDDAQKKWQEFREETGARLLYIPVARGYGQIEALADRVVPVDELNDETADSITWEVSRWMR